MREKESLATLILKLVLYEIAVVLATSELCSGAGMSAAVFTAAIAFLAAPKICEHLRLPFVYGIGLSAFVAANLVDFLFLDSTRFATHFGPGAAFVTADFMGSGLRAFGTVWFLRVLIWQFPALALFEAALPVTFFAWKLGSHRDLALHRPQNLSDEAWNLGLSPVFLLTLAGTLIFALTAALALRTKRLGQTLLQLFFILLLSGVLFSYYRDHSIKPHEKNNLFGIPGDDDSDSYKRGQNSGNGSGGGRGESRDGGASRSSQDEMPFSSSGTQSDNSPVALIRFLTDYTPPDEHYYLRQTAFSLFNGHRLIQDAGPDGDTDLVEALPTSGPLNLVIDPAATATTRQNVPHEIYAVYDPGRPFLLPNAFKIERIQNPDPTFFNLAYRVDAMATTVAFWNLAAQRPQLPKWSLAKTKAYLAMPMDPRYAALAGQIMTDYKVDPVQDPMLGVMSILDYLGKNAFYSGKSDHADADDPTASFLFGSRVGYCVHFSHAAVYLIRALGIPARVAAGYLVPDKRRGRSDSIMIMAHDAHAWPEVYLEPYGWITTDIPIENYLDPPSQEPSQSLQKTISQMAKQEPKEGSPEADTARIDWEKLIKEWLKKILLFLAAVLPSLLAFLCFLAYAYKAWRLWGWQLVSGRQQTFMAVRSLLDRLSFHGFRRDYGETREAMAQRVVNTLPNLTPLTWQLVGASFAKQWAPDEAALKQSMKDGAAALKMLPRNRGYWARILNPLSWMHRI